ncbi:MAG: shikimate kinase [Acidobacteria bacterium]|nr:shikimate kinase [Acidobacteriota bacterium]
MPPRGSTRNVRAICLAGFMGSGKSTVGRLLARQIGWRFVDLDELIESRARLDIPAIFERQGEAAFREMEYEALRRVLGESAERELPTVLALGGGTFAQQAGMALIRDYGCPVVWLQCSPEKLLSRCAMVINRPLFRDEASFLQLYRQRLPFYEQAEYRVESESQANIVVEKILALGILERVNA